MRTKDENGYPVLMSDVRIPIEVNLPIGYEIKNDDMQLFKSYAYIYYYL